MKDTYIKIFNQINTKPSEELKLQTINKLIAYRNANLKSDSSTSDRSRNAKLVSKNERSIEERKMERKNVWKRIIAIATAAVIVIALAISLPLILSNKDVAGTAGLSYSAIYENGEIIGYSVSKGKANTNGIIEIAGIYNGKPVTTIEKDAFSGTNITKVKLPSTIKYIKESAFQACTNLTEINIVSGVESIGMYAFSDCASLTTLIIPQSVVIIEAYAFSDSTSLTITVQGYTEKPSGWNSNWNKNQSNSGTIPVIWNKPDEKTSLTLAEAKQLITDTDLLASWEGFKATSIVTMPPGSEIEKATIITTAKGKTIINFVLVTEGFLEGSQITGTYIVNGFYYSVDEDNYYSSGNINQSEIDEFYFYNLTMSFLFTSENFGRLFESGTKTLFSEGNYKVEIQVDILNSIVESAALAGGTLGVLPEIEGKLIYTFNFNSSNQLTSFSVEPPADVFFISTATVEKFGGNIEEPEWFDISNYGQSDTQTTSLTLTEAKQLITGTDLLASWEGFKTTSIRIFVEDEESIEVRLGYIVKGNSISNFNVLNELYFDGKFYGGTYIKDGFSYDTNFNMTEINQSHIDGYYFEGLTLPFFFNEENFERLFESGTKTLYPEGNFKVEIHVDIKNWLTEVAFITGGEEPDDLSGIEGKVIYTFNFNSNNKLTSFSISNDYFEEDTILLMLLANVTVEKFDGNIEEPEWFDLSDYMD